MLVLDVLPLRLELPEPLERLELELLEPLELPEELLVCDVREEPLFELEAAPRRVVVEEPSLLMVVDVVREVPLVLTREVVVVEVGVTLRVGAEVLLPLVLLVRLLLEEVLVLLELLELLLPEVVLVRDELLELFELLVLEVELERLDEPELFPLVAAVRLVEVEPVVVVVCVLDATRFCRSRALLMEAVRLSPEALPALAIRLEKDCSG